MLGRLKYHWVLHRDWITKYPLPPITLDPALEPKLVELLRLLRPMKALGVPKKRYGSRHDGGYVMLDDLASVTGAYSLGVGFNVWWDIMMARKGLKVSQYDYTVNGPPRWHPNFSFHKCKIGIVDDPAVPEISLPTLLRTNRPAPSGDLILKVDIEGGEWEVFAKTNPDELRPFRQILVEMHNFSHVGDEAWRLQTLAALRNLARHHQLVHVHANNFGEVLHVGGLTVPGYLEVAYARRDAYQFVANDETFPGRWDHRNNPYYPDIPLGKFEF